MKNPGQIDKEKDEENFFSSSFSVEAQKKA